MQHQVRLQHRKGNIMQHQVRLHQPTLESARSVSAAALHSSVASRQEAINTALEQLLQLAEQSWQRYNPGTGLLLPDEAWNEAVVAITYLTAAVSLVSPAEPLATVRSAPPEAEETHRRLVEKRYMPLILEVERVLCVLHNRNWQNEPFDMRITRLSFAQHVCEVGIQLNLARRQWPDLSKAQPDRTKVLT